MKRFFIAAMALATIVGCSKDDGVDEVLTSGKKAVAIQITNAATSTTRANYTEGDTAQGDNEACAEASELQVLFANNAGVIVEHYALTAGTQTSVTEEIEDDNDNVDGITYMFHGVDQSVTQVAVARWDASKDSDITITNGSTNISVLLARAEDLEKNADRAVNEIALYGVDESLTKTGETHTGSPVDNNTHKEGETTTYYVYTAHVEVAPRFARIEVTGISCSDLGDENKDGVADGETGYDEMVLGSFTFTNSGYNYSLEAIEGVKWYGSYKYATGEGDAKVWASATDDKVVRSSTPSKGAWSWNVKPESDWSDMTLKLTVDAADYTVQVPARDLIIGDLKYNGSETDPSSLGFTATTVDGKSVYYLSTYKKNHIYRLNIPFKEKELEDVNEDMCVSVTVDIVNWVVVPVTPVFGK